MLRTLKRTLPLGRWFGLPAGIHITVWMVLAVVSFQALTWDLGLLMLLLYPLFLFGVGLHELAHALTAWKAGREPQAIILSPVGIGSFIRYTKPARTPMGELRVALSGPLVSALFGGLLLGIHALALPYISNTHGFANVIKWFGISQLAYAALNLLPAFPLDGGRILRAWWVPSIGVQEATQRVKKCGRVVAVLIVASAIFLSGQFWVLLFLALTIFITGEFEAKRQDVLKSFQQGREQAGADRELSPEDGLVVGPAPYERKKSSRS